MELDNCLHIKFLFFCIEYCDVFNLVPQYMNVNHGWCVDGATPHVGCGNKDLPKKLLAVSYLK